MDLISRQAVIEAMEDVDWYHINKDGQLTHGANSKEDEPLYKAEDVYKVLNDIPSAQSEIVRCKDCKYQEKFFHKDKRRKEGGYYIFGCELVDEYSHVCLDDDFCSRAERRTDE